MRRHLARLEIVKRLNALDAQARKSDQCLRERAAARRTRTRLHFDQPITIDTARHEGGTDVLDLECRHAIADHQHRAVERHVGDARQDSAIRQRFADAFLVYGEQAAREGPADRFAATAAPRAAATARTQGEWM